MCTNMTNTTEAASVTVRKLVDWAVVVHTFNLSAGEAGAGRSLLSSFQESQGYIEKSCLEKSKKKRKKERKKESKEN